jgi:hypothetical protein
VLSQSERERFAAGALPPPSLKGYNSIRQEPGLDRNSKGKTTWAIKEARFLERKNAFE